MSGPSRALLPAILIMLNVASVSSSEALHSRYLKDIEYSQVGNISLRMDAFLPASQEKTSAVIIVHGGGWVRGDRGIDVQPLFAPLEQAGFAWFSISYRLATDITQFGVAIDDVQAAIRYVKSNADQFNIDPNRIALIGESAGGQLAAMAFLRGGNNVSVQAFVGIYTPTDLVSLVKNSNYVSGQLRESLRGSPWENLVLAGLAQLSPVENVKKGMPPVLLIHGTSDSLVPFRQSEEMCARMRQIGQTCEIYPVPGGGHGIRWWESTGSSAGYKQKMASWLSQIIGSGARPQTAALRH